MTSKIGSNNPTISFLSLALFTVPIIIYKVFENESSKREKTRRRSSIGTIAKSSNPMIPPLPDSVRDLLSKCRLAYLSIVDLSFQSSHLCLMRFTYLKDEEVIIMSTNKKTKKYDMLQAQQGVALLVHDFGSGEDSIKGKYTITLNGNCQIVTGEEAERYRAEHLKHNPSYPQFIVGDDIAILLINVSSARICDIKDQVVHWSIGS